MTDNFTYDVFLSHNSNDKPRVRRLAERLKAAGLRVWLDEWAILGGDIIALKVDEGLEQSRVLLLCVSPAALASGWVALERSTAIHRDPANVNRRFIPILLEDCDLPDTIRRYKYLDFRDETDAAFKDLIAGLGLDIRPQKPHAKPEEPPVGPRKGLEAKLWLGPKNPKLPCADLNLHIEVLNGGTSTCRNYTISLTFPIRMFGRNWNPEEAATAVPTERGTGLEIVFHGSPGFPLHPGMRQYKNFTLEHAVKYTMAEGYENETVLEGCFLVQIFEENMPPKKDWVDCSAIADPQLIE